MSVTPAPQYQRNHTVVMLGWTTGTCNCGFAYQSRDGGATWSGWAIPVSSSLGLILPPDYPNDPRVLVSTGNSTPPCLMPALDAAICTPLPLVGIATFGARFDSGNPVIYGMIGPTGLAAQSFVAYDVATHIVRPVIRDLWYGGFLQVVMPSTARGPDVYLAYIGQDPSDGPVNAATAANPRQHYVIDACEANLTCAVASLDGLENNGLTRTDLDDPTGNVLAGVMSPASMQPFLTIGLTPDQGRSYPLRVTIDLRNQSAAYNYQVMGAGAQAALYVVSEIGSAAEKLVRYGLDGSVERLALPSAPGAAFIGIASLSPQRFIAYDASPLHLGYWCSTDGAHTWLSRCTAEH